MERSRIYLRGIEDPEKVSFFSIRLKPEKACLRVIFNLVLFLYKRRHLYYFYISIKNGKTINKIKGYFMYSYL